MCSSEEEGADEQGREKSKETKEEQNDPEGGTARGHKLGMGFEAGLRGRAALG